MHTKAHARREALGAKGFEGLAVVALFEQQEVLRGQLLQGDVVLFGQGAVFGHNGVKLAAFDRQGGHRPHCGRVHEAKVNSAFAHPLWDACVVALVKDDLHPGVVLPKAADDLRQPVARDARDATDPHQAALQAADLIGRAAHRKVLLDGALDGGQQLGPFRRERDARA